MYDDKNRMMIHIIALAFVVFFEFSAAHAARTISVKSDSCSSRRNSNADVVKLAHVIGTDDRLDEFIHGSDSGHYNSEIQAEVAQDSLAHLQCKQNGTWNTNTTGSFFVDVEDYARNNNILGNFSSCRRKVLVTVAHYINRWGGAASAKCKVRRSFDSSEVALSQNGEELTSDLGIVVKASVGGTTESLLSKDFAFLKIDKMRNSKKSDFKTLKICSDYVAMGSASGDKCDEYYHDDIILPHLARSMSDKHALRKGKNYRAKLSSGKCCISGKDSELDLLSHTCDMDRKSSGSPLLSISGHGEPCVVGIQKGHSVPGQSKENYAVSVLDEKFKKQMRNFIESSCSGSSTVSSFSKNL